LGTGSRLLGESQGASRKRCVDERTSRIAGKAPSQALFRHPIATVESAHASPSARRRHGRTGHGHALRPIAGLGAAPSARLEGGTGWRADLPRTRCSSRLPSAGASAWGALGIATRPGGRAASIGPSRPGRWLAPPGRRVEQLSQELAEVERSLAALLPSTRPICARSLASDPSAPRSCSSRAATPGGWSVKPPSPRSPAPARSTPRAGSSGDTDSTGAATGNSTGPYTSSPSPASRITTKRPPTTNGSWPEAEQPGKHAAASNARSPATSTDASTTNPRPP
jgi:hypothetical protein